VQTLRVTVWESPRNKNKIGRENPKRIDEINIWYVLKYKTSGKNRYNIYNFVPNNNVLCEFTFSEIQLKFRYNLWVLRRRLTFLKTIYTPLAIYLQVHSAIRLLVTFIYHNEFKILFSIYWLYLKCYFFIVFILYCAKYTFYFKNLLTLSTQTSLRESIYTQI